MCEEAKRVGKQATDNDEGEASDVDDDGNDDNDETDNRDEDGDDDNNDVAVDEDEIDDKSDDGAGRGGGGGNAIGVVGKGCSFFIDVVLPSVFSLAVLSSSWFFSFGRLLVGNNGNSWKQNQFYAVTKLQQHSGVYSLKILPITLDW